MHMPTDQEPAPTHGALRLIFEYDGDTVSLLHQLPVDMAVTGFETPQDTRPGRFAEVRDAHDVSLARVQIHGDTGTAEVFPETAGEPIMRVALEKPHGAFTVVVPAPAAAARVALLDVEAQAGSRDPNAPAPPPARETVIGVFPITGSEAGQ